jgi:hypothetical protein
VESPGRNPPHFEGKEEGSRAQLRKFCSGELSLLYCNANDSLVVVCVQGDLIDFPLLQRVTEAARVDAKNVTDIFEREIPLCVSGFDPFLGFLEETAFVRFTS